MSPSNDEHLYLEASQELDSGTQDPALWVKAMTLAVGDEEKARYRYIALRVEELTEAPASAPPEDPVPMIDSSDDGARSQPGNAESGKNLGGLSISFDEARDPLNILSVPGDQLCEEGRYEEAIDLYKMAIDIYPNHAKLYRHMGHALSRLGRETEAIAAYKSAIKINPDDVEAHQYLATATTKKRSS